MTDGKKTYAIVSGIVALLLVLALAFTVLMGSKTTMPSPTMKKQTSMKQNMVKKGGTTNSVRAVVRTPDMNRVTQSVTVKR